MDQQESQTNTHKKKVSDSNKKQTKTLFNKNKQGKHNRCYNSNFTRKAGESKDSKKNWKLSNEDDCPIHGRSHKWGQCHQNQYRENFCPRRSNPYPQFNNNSNWSQHTGFHQGPPNQVQVFSNESRASSSN